MDKMYADDNGILLLSPSGWMKMTVIVVEVCKEFRLTVSEERKNIPTSCA